MHGADSTPTQDPSLVGRSDAQARVPLPAVASQTPHASESHSPARTNGESSAAQASNSTHGAHGSSDLDDSSPSVYPLTTPTPGIASTTPFAAAGPAHAAYAMMHAQAQPPHAAAAGAAASSSAAAAAMASMPMAHGMMPWTSSLPSMPYMMPAATATMPGSSQAAAASAAAAMPMASYGTYAPSPQPDFLPQAMTAASAGMVPVGRTVYMGNLPSDVTAEELLDNVHFGPIENVRMLPEKNCAFVSFLCGQVAAAFHADSSVRRISLRNRELKIGWGKPSVPPPAVMYAVQHHNASRNVYLGQLDETVTDESLRTALGKFGPLDQVKLIREQNIAFVHFLSIQTAMKAVSSLLIDADWSKFRINYGKDRCAYVPKGQQQIQAHNHQAAAMGLATAMWLGYPTGYMNYGQIPQPPYFPADASGVGGGSGTDSSGTSSNGTSDSSRARGQPHPMLGNVEPQLHQFGNRTVYLGNLHPDTTAEDICNHVRGGILQSIRYMPDRHIAFVTFVDHNAALTFFHMALVSGISVLNRRLKVGWGKPSGPLSPAIALAVQSGASRNVYIGNISDPSRMSEDKIWHDLSQYGELEMVNTLRERSCAFANFTNIQSAIKCIEALKYNPDYQSVKVSFGKDRCGNLPKYFGKLALSRQAQGGGNAVSIPSAAAHDADTKHDAKTTGSSPDDRASGTPNGSPHPIPTA